MSADQDQRRRAIEQTERSFVVEASAGTGKTSVLIRRILHCVLERGPNHEPLPLSRICAITFTEKAAGEMKIRLRQEFEKSAVREDGVGARARVALEELEGAAISTFHSFAVSMLKERPIEAGLDPRFKPLDELQSELLFQKVWDTWMQRAVQERKPPLEAALRAHIGLDALQCAANTIRRHAHDVRRMPFPAPPSDFETRRALAGMLETGREFLKQAADTADKLVPCLEQALEWLADPSGSGCPAKPGAKGAAGKWNGGKPAVEAVREFIRDTVDFRNELALYPVRRVLDAMLRLIIGEFLPEWEAHKRERGFLDFDDLLWCARDLLKSSRAAREEFQRRFAALLVDEFQDTDPVQWELIHLLAADSPPGSGASAIAPGRLFIVGDPKQSIYRFRGADIETYGKITAAPIMQQLGLERLELTTNFRSVPSILGFVDAAFRGVMTKAPDRPYQPEYLAFGGKGERQGLSGAACVHILADRKEDGSLAGSGRDFFATESRRIVSLIHAMRAGTEWEVQDRAGWHAPRLRDIAILLPVLTRADELENELRESGIPYVLEGGKFYYKRSEVSSAVNVLRAIANPNDGVALYGALRSIFFGISDEEILRARVAGLPFDYRGEFPESSILHRPCRILYALHLRRHERSASETLERLFQQTGAREVLAARGIQSFANLNKLVRTLRALQHDSTFSEVIELVSHIDEDAVSETESRVMEEHSDAVRVLTVHRAKGLDFPIVIVAGLGLKRLSRQRDFLVDAHRQRACGIRVGAKDTGLRTHNFDELAENEKEHEKAELARLLYVALTRARDHLVVCTHNRGKECAGDSAPAAVFKSTRLEPLDSFLAGIGGPLSPQVRFIDVNALPAPAPTAAVATGLRKPSGAASLETQYRELDRLITETPAGLGLHAATEGPGHKTDDEIAPAPALARAVRIGIAFHEAIDQAGLESGLNSRDLALQTGGHHAMDEDALRELESMLAGTLGSALLERARHAQAAGGRVCREMPYVRPVGPARAGVEEGKIDLLFEENNGWVLVDYKTDRMPKETAAAPFFKEKYAAQVETYIDGLRSVGIKVSEAYLLLARTGEQIRILF